MSTLSAPAALHRMRTCPKYQRNSPALALGKVQNNENTDNVNSDPLSVVITQSKCAPGSSDDEHVKRKSTRIKCEGESNNNLCLCGLLRPLYRTWQILGILPLSHNTQTCEFGRKSYSLPALVNYIWVLASIPLVTWVFYGTDNILRNTRAYSDSNQTDFYSFSITIVLGGICGVVIYLSGSRGAKNVAEGLNLLHSSVEGLSPSSFVTMKRIVKLVPLAVLVGLLLDMGSMFCGYSRDGLNFDPGPLAGAVFLANFLPNLVCSSYTALLCVVAVGFNTVNKRVKHMLMNLSKFPFTVTTEQLQLDSIHGTPKEVSDLRLTHENLCSASRRLQKAFGVQMLAIFSSSGVNFIAGIYGLIISTNGLLSTPELKNLILAASIASTLAGLRILATLAICQYVINRSNETSQVLNAYDHEYPTWNDEVTMQVDMFRKKIGLFPLKINCCDVFPLSTSILAAVAGNSVTYVLVLLQFKLT